MSHDASLQRIAAWIQREDEELLYEPDCGEPTRDPLDAFRQQVADRYRDGIAAVVFPLLFPPDIALDGTLRWSADDPLGLPMLDASEE